MINTDMKEASIIIALFSLPAIMKLLGIIKCSWWWALSPYIALAILIAVIFLSGVVAFQIKKRKMTK